MYWDILEYTYTKIHEPSNILTTSNYLELSKIEEVVNWPIIDSPK